MIIMIGRTSISWGGESTLIVSFKKWLIEGWILIWCAWLGDSCRLVVTVYPILVSLLLIIQIRIQMQINSKYEILEKVGNGNFSTVYTARQHQTQHVTALKVMKTHQNIALKEAYLLKSFEHPNIIKVFDFEQDTASGETRMALEYLPQNTLELYEEQRYGLREEQVKCILFQAALGLAYIHERGIIHRDIKPENILIDKTSAEIKLIDFGLAIPTHKITTDYVATRWYRAPENLLGTKEYMPAIDVFSVACVAVELYLGAPLFPGADNIDQLHKIFNVLGEPKQDDWPLGHRKFIELGLRNVEKKTQSPMGLQSVLKSGSQSFVNLMKLMLMLNPAKRIASRDVIHHSYFKDVRLIIPPHIYKRFEKDHLKQSKVKSNTLLVQNNIREERKMSMNKQPTFSQLASQKESLNLAYSPRKIAQNEQYNHADKSTVKRNSKEPENIINNSLSFRGFHPIKTNKISVREVQKQAESNSRNKVQKDQKDSRNNSIDSYRFNQGKNISNSIELARKIIKNNIAPESSFIVERRLTTDGRDFRTPEIKTKSNDKAKNIYFHSPTMLSPSGTKSPLQGYNPMKSYLVEYASTVQPQPVKYNSVSPNQNMRITRNNSEINTPTHRRMAPEQPKPNFLGRERDKTSVSPSTISINSPKIYMKPLQNNLQGHKQTIYTTPIDKQKGKTALEYGNNFFKKELHDVSFDRPQHSISFLQNRSRMLVNTVEFDRKIDKLKEYKHEPFQFPVRMHNHLEQKQVQNIKIVKSLQSRQIADASKIRPPGFTNSRENTEQRPSIILLDKKDYREPRIITNKCAQNEQRGSVINDYLKRETDRNISINLNLSIIERQKSVDSNVMRERRGRI